MSRRIILESQMLRVKNRALLAQARLLCGWLRQTRWMPAGRRLEAGDEPGDR